MRKFLGLWLGDLKQNLQLGGHSSLLSSNIFVKESLIKS